MDLRASMTTADIVNVLDINSMVSEMVDRDEIAESVLDHIHSFVPFVAASLQLWDPVNGTHRTIANRGYSEAQVAHLDTWFVRRDEAFRYMREVDAAPLRWADMPFDYRSGFSAQTYWLPAGFREGVTTCLFAADGRYTGNLHLNTDSPAHPSDGNRGALAALQPILSTVTDVLREPAYLARMIEPDVHCTVASAQGNCHEVPGHVSGPWLHTDGALIKAIMQSTARRTHWAGLWQDGAAQWHRVSHNAVETGYLITERPATVPYGLTSRELEVLTLLTRSRTNVQIASELMISSKTAGRHIENLMSKLGCVSRTGAAVLALEEGLTQLHAASRPPCP